MRVEAEIEETSLYDGDRKVPGVKAICTKCGHTTESFGTSDRSKNRCLVLLKEECPEDESNFYVEE